MYYVAPIPTEIINGTLETGHWPEGWKTSIVKPLYKWKGMKEDAKNYCPVPPTDSLGRIAKGVSNAQLME